MKYSVRGFISPNYDTDVVGIINQYELWRLYTKLIRERGTNNPIFTFEVWLNDAEDKDSLFNNLKDYVHTSNEFIDWHECTHDELEPSPCVISEEYRGD